MSRAWFGHEPALRGLPITVRPMSGERAELYLRRLAHANHLEPSCLQQSAAGPPGLGMHDYPG
jgi:hypothetical protein